MKVMIVEDEPLLRQGLVSKIDWGSLGLELAGEAANGMEALERLACAAPDIVLTDVRMPGMDGLAFIEQAKQRHPGLKFVIISGFDEFDYVREAMRHQVKDYLLKPVDARKLRELLAELCRELKEEREADEAASYWAGIGRMYRERGLEPEDHRLTRILMDTGHDWSHGPRALEGTTYCAAASAVAGRLPDCCFAAEDEALIRFAVLNVLREALEPAQLAVKAFNHAVHADEIVLLLGFDAHDRLEAAAERLVGALEWLRVRLGLSVFIGIGETKSQPGQIRRSYQEARGALKDRLLPGERRVFRSSGEPQSYPVLGESAQMAFRLLLEEGNEADFIRQAESMFRKLAEVPGARFAQFEFLYREFVHLIRRMTAGAGSDTADTRLPDPAEELEDLEELNAWHGVGDLLRRRLAGRAERAFRTDERSGKAIAADAKAYADEHYAENLTLQWVADTYHIHPNYFSRCFKQHVGTSFNDYLTRVRIERSKELLRGSSLKIARIAALAGYEDQNYFCNVFKRLTGKSPSAFREERG